MQDWIDTYLNIRLPMGHIDPDSNSSPIEAMYEAYSTYRDDLCLQVKGYIWLSSRDSGKTLCGSILNVILMIHFKAQIAHLAATRKQSEKSLQYCNTFIRQLRPYLEASGRSIITESKSKIQILNEDTSVSYIDVIVANLAGGNSEHLPVVSFDEIDTLSPQGLVGYKEAQLIPTRYKGKGPLVVKFSTRKFAFGIFEQEIQNINKTGELLRRWNIMDITEHCPSSRHLPELDKVERYVKLDLPLTNLSIEELSQLPTKDQAGYEKITAYAGCAKCPLLPVCRTRLAHRPNTDKGGLYKEIDFTIRQFQITSDDMASAQLMCWKPSQSGLVYPRFDKADNTMTLADAYSQFTGNSASKDLTISSLTNVMREKGIRIQVGGDWGHAHATAFIVTAVMPGGDWWILDAHSISGLEFDEILSLAIKIRNTYKPTAWYMDTNQPMFIKTFRKNGMPCKSFTKDVLGGIECVRGQLLDALGRRRLKIILHDRTQIVVDGLSKHHFKLDSVGNPTDDPDDDEVWSDICDSLRYVAQNLFKPRGGIHSPGHTLDSNTSAAKTSHKYDDWMAQKTRQMNIETNAGAQGKTQDGNVIWDFGKDEE
jgi:hypothetical protein